MWAVVGGGLLVKDKGEGVPAAVWGGERVAGDTTLHPIPSSLIPSSAHAHTPSLPRQNFAHLSHRAALSVHTANMFLYLAVIPLGGWLSDKYGRTRVILLPAVAMAVVAYPLWCLFKTGSAGAAWFAQAALVCLMATFTGALPATFVALFPSEYR